LGINAIYFIKCDSLDYAGYLTGEVTLEDSHLVSIERFGAIGRNLK